MPRAQHNLRDEWLAAAGNAVIAAELEAIYTIIADQIAARQPLCEVSGRCCNFEAHGHRLYVTGLEAAYMVARLPPEQRPTVDAIAAARARGDCPYLVNKLCTAQLVKPLGCRVYFCDPTAQQWQQELSERTLAMVRQLHERHGIEYRYGEWRGMLEVFAEGGGGA